MEHRDAILFMTRRACLLLPMVYCCMSLKSHLDFSYFNLIKRPASTLLAPLSTGEDPPMVQDTTALEFCY